MVFVPVVMHNQNTEPMNTSDISHSASQARSHFEYTDWKEKFARFGHVAKGAVYAIAGVLSFQAAFNMGGGQTTGKTGVIEFLQNQPFGQVLLILMAVGLACYAFYRFMLVAGKSERLESKSEGKRKALKAGYVVSGLVYLALAVYAIMEVAGGGGGGGGSSKQSVLSQIMSQSWGPIFFYAVAAGLAAKAIAQFAKVIKNDFYKYVRQNDVDPEKARKAVKISGTAGYIARGILVAITAWFFYEAAATHNASQAQGSEGAFAFLDQMSSGPWLMGAVAAGLVLYGIYMFILARYRPFHIR